MNVSIILPILNEEHIIGETVPSLLHAMTPLADHVELIAVDDGSTDGTRALLDEMASRDPRIRVVHHPLNKGYGAAIKSGLTASTHDWIFFTDADLQFRPDDIQLLIPYADQYDFIVGFRANRADSLKRRIISSAYNRIVRIMFSLPVRDVDCAFKLMRRSALLEIPFQSDSFFVSVELMARTHRLGYRIIEVGVAHYPRARGESKVTTARILLTVRDLFRLFFGMK